MLNSLTIIVINEDNKRVSLNSNWVQLLLAECESEVFHCLYYSIISYGQWEAHLIPSLSAGGQAQGG